jgi:penicillin-binding protein 2
VSTLEEPIAQLREEPIAQLRRPARFAAFGIAVVLVLSGLTSRLFFLQLSEKPGAGAPAAAQALVPTTTIDSEPLPAMRGVIYDRSHRPLVENVRTFAVSIRQADLPLTRRPDIARRLGGLLKISPEQIITTLDSSPNSNFEPVTIAHDVPEDVASLISEDSLTLPGVSIVVEPQRKYLSGSLLTQVVGWTGKIDAASYEELRNRGYLATDRIGKTGVEATYEAELRGQYGFQQVEKDATGATVRVVSTTPATAGDSLVLTIDTREQQLATKALAWGLKAIGKKRGAMVVLNPQTGEVLALVSLPTYDGNAFTNGISQADYAKLLKDPDKPLINHAINEIQPPGSTFKLVTGLGALADKKLGKTETLATATSITIAGAKFKDWKVGGFGRLDIKGGFGNSSDTFFYQVAQRLGMSRLSYWANQLGYNKASGIDLPNEASGLVPSDQWAMRTFGRNIYPGEVVQAGIGQGYDLATPLQVANAYATLANGGKVMQPQVVKEVIDASGKVVRPFVPKVVSKVNAPAWVFTTMREAARRVVTIRHTNTVADMPIVVAGKTGTAEYGLRDKSGHLPYHTWFAGFLPRNYLKSSNPSGSVSRPDSQLAFCVFVYDAGTLGNASVEIAKYWLQLRFHLKHDYRNPVMMRVTNFATGGF